MAASEQDPLLQCLLFLVRHHGSYTTAEALLAGLPLGDKGLTPTLFTRAAERAGLSAHLARKPLLHIQQGSLPAILLLKDESACLLLEIDHTNQQARILDPLKENQEITLKLTDLNQRYSGYTLFARLQFQYDSRAPSVGNKSDHHWFWSELKRNIPLYRDVLVAAFIINLFALSIPMFTMNVYDRVVPNYALETLWVLGSGVIIVLAADLLLRTMRAYFLDKAGRRTDIRLSSKIMEQVLGMQLESRPHSTGSFAASLRSYETIRDFITSATITSLIDLPFTILFIGVIAWIAPLMALPVLIGITAAICFSLVVRKRMQALAESSYRAGAMRNAVLVESLSGLDTLKAVSAEGQMQQKWESSTTFLAHINLQLRQLSASCLHVTQWLQQLVTVFIVITGVYLIAAGELTLGGLIACSILSSRTMMPLAQVSGLLTQYHQATTSMGALNEIMERPLERPAGKRFIAIPEIRGDIEFRNVTFCYPGSDAPILKDVSFTIKQGEHIAILGRIGSGKSTIIRLAMGLFRPTEGAVLVDGIDIRQLDPGQLRQHIGYVPQDVTLFYGTMRDNIALADRHADDEALRNAAEMAGLGEVINNHPQGFDMLVQERGDSLSGGQRKAVSLARALVHRPPILLLDEPTGSMDHTSETWVNNNLKEYSQGKTVISVTHRNSLLDWASRIIVIDKGKVVADGPKENVVEMLRQGRVGKAL